MGCMHMNMHVHVHMRVFGCMCIGPSSCGPQTGPTASVKCLLTCQLRNVTGHVSLTCVAPWQNHYNSLIHVSVSNTNCAAIIV